MKKELKPCPFCGGEPKQSKVYPMWVCCYDCGASTRNCRTTLEAEKAWNTRDLSQITIDEGEAEKIFKNPPRKKPIMSGREQPIAIPIWKVYGSTDLIQALKKANIIKVGK